MHAITSAAHPRRSRAGLSLLEVIVSLAIFFVALVAINYLFQFAGELAAQAQRKQQAMFLCQSKMAEFSVGAQELVTTPNADIADMKDWTWSATCTPTEIDSLVRVEVTVAWENKPQPPVKVQLTQLILRPQQRGSTLDPTPVRTTDMEEAIP